MSLNIAMGAAAPPEVGEAAAGADEDAVADSDIDMLIF